jgi:membrane associated rhomboid family serine protease
VTERSEEKTQGLWRRLWRSNARAAAAAALGAAGAAAYAHFIGCRTGTCLLTSNVWVASLYGALVGAVVGWPDRRRKAQERAPAGRG